MKTAFALPLLLSSLCLAQVGYVPLPKGLEKDPSKLKIPPLDLQVRKPERKELPNGIVVYLLEDRTAPLVSLRALFVAGSVDEDPKKLGVASLTFDLMAEAGAGALSADALDELLEFHAADVGGGAGEEYSTLDLSVRSEDLDKLFPVFTDIVRRPRFDKDRFDVGVAQFIEGVRRRPDSPDGLSHRALRKAVYGKDSPFARETTEAILKTLTVKDVKDFHAARVNPKSTVLLFTGDFDKSKLLALVDKHFGDWKGGERPKRTFEEPAKLTRRVIFVPKEIAQAKIRIGAFGYQRLSPDEYAIRVMNTALGGGIGVGRMYKEVRDTKGLAYSAYSSASPGPTHGMFFAGVDTKPEQTTQAVDATLQILSETASTRPFTKKELSLAADMFLNSFAFRFDEADKIAREKAVFDLFGYPDDYLDKYRENISKVDEAASLAAAKKLLVPGEYQIVVVGPAKAVGDLSRFGPVTTITDVEAFK